MSVETIVIAVWAATAITVHIFHAIERKAHAEERKDLYSRIMASNLREYQEGTSERQPSKPTKGNHIKRTLDKQYDLRER